MTNENNLNEMERGKNIIMELLNIAEIGFESEIQENEFNGDIFIISDGKFIKGLTGNEFLVYYAFLGILSRHNNNGQHYFYKKELNWSELEQDLRLKGRIKDTIMKRTTMKSTFDSLVKKKVFKLVTLDNGDEVYYIVNIKGYLFTRMSKETYDSFSKTLSGDALKIYCFIKGNLDNVKSNGGKILYMNRQTIAENCGITNKKGKIEERQLRAVGTILKTLGSFGVIDYALVKKVVDGKTMSRYEIYGVTTEIKQETVKQVA